MEPEPLAYHRRVETNTDAIVRLGWARILGLPDDALEAGEGSRPTLWVESSDTVMVLRLWDRHVLVGPEWLQQRTLGVHPLQLEDESVLLRCCEGHPARLIGQAEEPGPAEPHDGVGVRLHPAMVGQRLRLDPQTRAPEPAPLARCD